MFVVFSSFEFKLAKRTFLFFCVILHSNDTSTAVWVEKFATHHRIYERYRWVRSEVDTEQTKKNEAGSSHKLADRLLFSLAAESSNSKQINLTIR